MEKIYQKIFEDIKKAKKILLVTHKNPDGDALGSVCAMIGVLERLNKDYTGFITETVGKNLSYLPYVEQLALEYDELSKYDLIISLDAGDLNRIEIEDIGDHAHKIINIDHHFAGADFGYLSVKNPSASSTTEILSDIFKVIGINIDKPIATCLLTGILTDTHNFSNPMTTISSLRIASDLMLCGAKIHDIVKYCFYNKSFVSVKFLGKVFDNLLINKNYNIVIAVITLKDLEDIKEVDEDVTEGVAGFLNNMSGVDLILVLKEQENGMLRGSLRTTVPNLDVSKLAKRLGGGGHKKAAGFSVSGNILKDGEKWKVR